MECKHFPSKVTLTFTSPWPLLHLDLLLQYWHDELASFAQAWADRCDMNHGQVRKKPYPFKQMGQNLYYRSVQYPSKQMGQNLYYRSVWVSTHPNSIIPVIELKQGHVNWIAIWWQQTTSLLPCRSSNYSVEHAIKPFHNERFYLDFKTWVCSAPTCGHFTQVNTYTGKHCTQVNTTHR